MNTSTITLSLEAQLDNVPVGTSSLYHTVYINQSREITIFVSLFIIFI